MPDRDAVPDLSACCPTCESEVPLASACSLTPDGLEERLAEMRSLARRALIAAERDGLTLLLVYRSAARGEVAGLVARESECCAFLGFRLEETQEGLRVTVTAPDHASTAAGDLFDALEGRDPAGAGVSGGSIPEEGVSSRRGRQPPEMAGDGS